ncbi:MAG: VCBS repeat-containing protein [Gammaproteobacteria bacterium]|nr:VCBS repeat-containing protein [Gammaproteobacteria bacterium]
MLKDLKRNSVPTLVVFITMVLTLGSCTGTRIDEDADPEDLFGLFKKIERLEANDTPTGAGIGDINGDGILDLIFPATPLEATQAPANDSINPDENPNNAIAQVGEIYLGKGDGTFTHSINIELLTGLIYGDLQIGDLNGDGYPDLLYYSSDSIYLHKGGPSLESLKQGYLVWAQENAGNTSFGALIADRVALADFNSDNELDLFVSRWDPGSTDIESGKDAGTPRNLEVAVFEGHFPDIGSGNNWHFLSPINVSRDYQVFAFGNVDTNSELDFIGTHFSSQSIAKLVRNKQGLHHDLTVSDNLNPYRVIAANFSDVDGDGDQDVIVLRGYDDADENASVFEISVSETQNEISNQYHPNPNSQSLKGIKLPRYETISEVTVALGDFNGDGLADAVITSPREHKDVVYFVRQDPNTEEGYVVGALDVTKYLSRDLAFVYDLRVADFDNNGRPDLMLGIADELDIGFTGGSYKYYQFYLSLD